MNIKRYCFEVIRAGIFLILFSGSSCPSYEQPVSNSSAESPEAKSRIDPEKIFAPSFKKITSERCLKLQEDALMNRCITKKELEDLKALNAAPFCEDGYPLNIVFCEKDPR